MQFALTSPASGWEGDGLFLGKGTGCSWHSQTREFRRKLRISHLEHLTWPFGRSRFRLRALEGRTREQRELARAMKEMRSSNPRPSDCSAGRRGRAVPAGKGTGCSWHSQTRQFRRKLRISHLNISLNRSGALASDFAQSKDEPRTTRTGKGDRRKEKFESKASRASLGPG